VCGGSLARRRTAPTTRILRGRGSTPQGRARVATTSLVGFSTWKGPRATGVAICAAVDAVQACAWMACVPRAVGIPRALMMGLSVLCLFRASLLPLIILETPAERKAPSPLSLRAELVDLIYVTAQGFASLGLVAAILFISSGALAPLPAVMAGIHLCAVSLGFHAWYAKKLSLRP